MAILQTGSGGPDELLRNYWQNQLMKVLRNDLLAGDLMDKQTIPAYSGRTVEFRRISSFSKQVTGVSQHLGYATQGDLKGRTFSIDSVVYSLELITNDLEIEELAAITTEPNAIPDLTEEFFQNAKDTCDQRYINIMVNNTGNTASATAPSVEYMGASVSVTNIWGDGSQTLTEATLDADNPSHRIAAETFNTASTQLKMQRAKPRMASRAGYDALIPSEIAGDLRTDATFQDIALKGDMRGEDKFERGMIGEVFNVRVTEDQNVSTGVKGTVDSTNDYIIRCPVVGLKYAAIIDHAKGIGRPRVNFLPPSKADKNDPYGLMGILTWKMYQATGGIVNPRAGVIIRCATTRAKVTDSYGADGPWDLN